MLTEPTIDKLKALHLYTMANAWIAQRGDPSMHDIDFDTRLGFIIDAELLARDNKRITRLLREAKLRIPGACMEDIDLGARRELEKPQIKMLATGCHRARSASAGRARSAAA